MDKFKIGDVVVINTSKNPFMDEYHGMLGLLEGIANFSVGWYWVRINEKTHMWFNGPEMIKIGVL